MIVLGLGSNIGDREGHLKTAIKYLEQHNIKIIKISSIYESEALLKPGSPAEWNMPYLNMAVLVETILAPIYLLNLVKNIEQIMGRNKIGEFSPREIDIDILAYDDLCFSTERLTIPHHGLLERDFAIVPFAEIYGDFIYPGLGEFCGKDIGDIATAFSCKNIIVT